ncbi:MAG: methyltransferase, TrmH family [Gaiellaceae bacterium]|nr:methyltransferase, TrmH family [Gaiellaceae bacterium]
MAREVIRSAANERLKRVRKLASAKERDETGLFVAEGEDLVAAALDVGIRPVEAFVDAERPVLEERLPEAVAVEPSVLERVSTLAHPPRIIAVFSRGDLPAAGAERVALALWDVSDPGNVGALVRAADGLGPARLCLSGRSADPSGPKALRASMGALFRVPIVGFDEGVGERVALVAHGGTPLPELELPGEVTFVLGAERAGLPAEVVAACAATATIPLAGRAESLNVALAGAIALYEWRRRLPASAAATASAATAAEPPAAEAGR